MANNAVVGILRALLTADTAQFESGMRKASDSAKAFSREAKQIGQQASDIGQRMTTTLTLPIVAAFGSSAKAAIDFESSFAGVRKTVNASEPEFQAMAQQFRNLSKQIPINVNDLNRLGEAAGALGIPKKEIVDFSRVMALLGVTTNVTADQAAESIAKIQNIFGAAGKATENFASTLVDLGNNGASTEAEILELAKRIASAGNTVGVSQAQVLGFASAIANVGMEAEAGGSAMSRVFNEISGAVSAGGSKLEAFAKLAGKSAQDFAVAFRTDAAGATRDFIEGLGKVQKSGGDLNQTLGELGFTELRQADLLRRLAGSGDNVRTSLDLAGKAWERNTALTAEAQKRFETTESQLKLLWNRIKDVGITLGNALLPMIRAAVDVFGKFMPVIEKVAEFFAGLPMPIQLAIVGFAGAVAAIGPLVFIFGQLTLSASAIVGAFGTAGIATKGLNALMAVMSGNTASLTGVMGTATTAATLFGKAVAVVGAFMAGWEIGKVIRDVKLFGESAMTIGESFEFGATKLRNWVSGVKASDADIETAILSQRKLAQAQADGTLKTKEHTDATKQGGQAAAAAAPQHATLSQELKAAQVALANLSVAKKADIAAGIAMGKSAKDIAEAVGVSEQVVEIYKDKLQKATAATKEAETAHKAWAKAIDSVNAELSKLSFEMAKEQNKQNAAQAEKTADQQLASFNRISAAQREAAKASNDIELQRAEYQIEQAKRRGASEQQLYEMERALGQRKLQLAIEEVDREFALRAAGLDRTTAWGEKEYQALQHAHEMTIAQMTDDFERGEALKRQDIARTASVWVQSFDVVRQGFTRIKDDILSNLGGLLFNFGADMDGTLKKTAEDAKRHYEELKASGTASAADIHDAFEKMREAEDAANVTFGERFKGLWHGIKESLFSIFNDILGMFVNSFLKGLLGAMTGQKGAFASAFGGLFGGGGQGGGGGILSGLFGGGGGGGLFGGGGAGAGGAGGGGGGLLGGLFGMFGGGGGGNVGSNGLGNVNGTLDSLQAGGSSLMGNLTRFGGGGLMAAGGALQFLGAGDSWLKNISAGAQTGAGIGTMVLPGIGTLVGAGVGAAGGAIKAGLQKLFGGPDAKEQSGREVSTEFKQTIASMLNDQQKVEAGGEEWKATVIGVRDAYLATGKTEAEAFAAVNAMYAAEKKGGDAVHQALIPINAALQEQRTKAEQMGASLVDSFRKGEMGAEDVMDALARIKAPNDIVIKIRTQIEGGGAGSVGNLPLGSLTGSDTATRAERQGGSGSGAVGAIATYRSEHPERAAEIDDFLRKNPEDYDRLARILGIPGFHTGGVVQPVAKTSNPGEVLARLMVGEGVLTAGGMDRLGGADVLAALNTGNFSDPMAAMGGQLAAYRAGGQRGSAMAAPAASGRAGGGNGDIHLHLDSVVISAIDARGVSEFVESGAFISGLETAVRRDRAGIRSSLAAMLAT